ncbi:nickel/cobalt transporter [Sulfitobacter sp. JB4-11]|uniref:nickel/cobalt transporter n=1 Tax=Sulfitobacter rhodophyticola TaxID=3238304 RepID=UPI0035187E85
MRRILSLGALALLVVLAGFWLTGGFDRLGVWAAQQQRGFQDSIALSLRSVRAGEAGAIIALLGACFAYGLAHAAGPGHGKVLIGGYGMARSVPMTRLSLIALAASLGQAVTAVVLVYAGVFILNLGREALVGVTENVMAPASYGAITVIGFWLMWRGFRRMRAPVVDHVHEGDGATCSSCGHAHGPTLDQVSETRSLRDALLLIGGIAVRPCTGALFVLILTWQMGIGLIGIAGAFAMAIGTALVTIAVGLAAGGLRGGMLAGISGSPRFVQVAAAVEVLAGCVVALLAGGLLLRAL